ncbi:uncharacterized protein LOC105226975 [Bactrocera dorsalis]|uniref:Uncharacterized protein LOC105226975 n=1 Tax=Bactrocera dorsalis TaxID=27457 RepID=A0A9B2GYY1_BACDO|nr:uncharacterized protein LOC105226975 [Bactrocera dorsalis]
MKIKRSPCLTRSLAALAMCCCVSQLMIVVAAPQNYLEQAAAGAMDMAMKMGEILQNGGAARKEFGFQLPGMSMHSKTAVGMGEAMIQRSDSSEEDSDERRKRSLTSDELPDGGAGKGPHTTFTKLMRNINAPCIGGGTGGGTGGAGDGGDGEDIVDEARRRIARMKARKAAGGKKSTTSKSKKKSGRRRRQVEAADLEGLGESEQAALQAEFRAHMQQFAEKMNHAYEHIAASVMEMMKRMEENFYAEGNK